MDHPALLRTGTFARASSLSVKALRVYHEMGLLVPSVVDPDTGYRAYAPAQLNDAAIILLLREVGTPLQDIRAVLDARDLDLVRKLLDEQAARFQAGLDAVAQFIDDLSLDDDGDAEGVEIRYEPARLVLAIDGNPLLTELAPFAHRADATLHEAAVASGAVIDGPFGAAFPIPVEDDRQVVNAYRADRRAGPDRRDVPRCRRAGGRAARRGRRDARAPRPPSRPRGGVPTARHLGGVPRRARRPSGAGVVRDTARRTGGRRRHPSAVARRSRHDAR